MPHQRFRKLNRAPLRLAWALLAIGLGAAALPARAATQVPAELQHLSARARVRATENEPQKRRDEQAAAALKADQRQKAARRALILGANARARQRAVEISQQVRTPQVLFGSPRRAGAPVAAGIVLLIAGTSLARWLHRRLV
jgi:hypothetical protein